ncbi:MarR family transcriptional regulator [soil metagenome]
MDLRESPARESVGFLLALAAHRFRMEFERKLEPLGLQVKHFGILATISHFGPVPQQQLVLSVCIDRTSMVALIDELEGARLVERHPDPEDRRAYRVHLTAEGIEANRRAMELLRESEAECLKALGAEQRDELKKILAMLGDFDHSSGFEHINIKRNTSKSP